MKVTWRCERASRGRWHVYWTLTAAGQRSRSSGKLIADERDLCAEMRVLLVSLDAAVAAMWARLAERLG